LPFPKKKVRLEFFAQVSCALD